jgi:hypothetical protein
VDGKSSPCGLENMMCIICSHFTGDTTCKKQQSNHRVASGIQAWRVKLKTHSPATQSPQIPKLFSHLASENSYLLARSKKNLSTPLAINTNIVAVDWIAVNAKFQFLPNHFPPHACPNKKSNNKMK